MRKQVLVQNNEFFIICSKCKIKKPIEEFPKLPGAFHDVRGQCKKCYNQISAKRQKFCRDENPEKYRIRVRQWRSKNRKKIQQTTKRFNQKIKKEIVFHYSKGTMCCKCCKESIIEFLTIEHKKGTRKKYNHSFKFGGVQLYVWLKKRRFPPGFEILCMNCNLARGVYGECPHER